MSTREGRVNPHDILRQFRVNQWTKNAIVLAAVFFAFWDRSQPKPLGLVEILDAVLAALLFSLVSSAIYILNDIRDVAEDRLHPTKKKRPIASGRLSVALGWRMFTVLLLIGLTGSYLLEPRFYLVVTAYVIIQLIYSFGLKQVAMVDIFVIAAGFVLRAIAGAVVVKVDISPWLLLCTFLLALFLALCKRRHEKILSDDQGTQHRAALEKYDRRLLDQFIAITSGATIVSYALYTLWPETCEKFGTRSLGFTIPFVVFGIFRYLDLVYRHDKGDRPERILLTDIPLLATLVLYGLTMVAIFLLNA